MLPDEILDKIDEAQKIIDYLKPEIKLRDIMWLVIDDLKDYLWVELSDEATHTIENFEPKFVFVTGLDKILTEHTECVKKSFEDYLVNHYGDD